MPFNSDRVTITAIQHAGWSLLAALLFTTGARAAELSAEQMPGCAAAVVVENSPQKATNSLAASLSGYVPDDKYKLRPGDRVALQIVEDRDLPKSLALADSGELDVPYVGRVVAKDKSCKQLGEEIKALLEKEYYHRATVIIALDAASKYLGRVYVWGQVRSQGPIEVMVNENITVGKAILRAGGFADFANKKKVKVIRAESAGGSKQTFIVNLAEVLEEGKTENDILLRPDDFIMVPSRLVNF